RATDRVRALVPEGHRSDPVRIDRQGPRLVPGRRRAPRRALEGTADSARAAEDRGDSASGDRLGAGASAGELTLDAVLPPSPVALAGDDSPAEAAAEAAPV